MFKRLKLKRPFYGWWIVGAVFLIAMYFGGAVIYGFTTIFEPLVKEFGWSYTQVSAAASLRGIEGALLAPVMGAGVDRFGPRKVISFGGVTTFLGLLTLSQANSLLMFYGAFVLIAVGISACVSTVLLTPLAHWFHRKIGIANGIAVSGFGFGGLLVPVMVYLVDSHGWRTSSTIMGLGMLLFVLPLSIIIRHKPEPYGYWPDGIPPRKEEVKEKESKSTSAEVNYGARQAFASRTLWHIAMAYLLQSVGLNALFTHVMPYLSGIGIIRSTAGVVSSSLPLLSIIGRIGLGWVGDKFERKRIAALSFIMVAGGLFCFGFAAIAGPWILIPFILLFGIGYGGAIVQRPSLSREFFGRANFGTILGLIMGILMVGETAGPPLTGWVYDHWGSYKNIWHIYGILTLLASVSVITIPKAKITPTSNDSIHTENS